jgi:small conductance mechanosensitive channel
MNILESLNKIAIGTMSLSAILQAVLVFAVCFAVVKTVTKILAKLMSKSKAENAIKSFTVSAVKIGLWCLTAVIVAGSLGIPTASLVAVLSVAGLALSLSIQGIMSNLFSGFTILTTRPFSSGDYTELGGVSGTVVDVNFFYTKMLTVDKKLIYIPNSDVTSSKITNYSREPVRRIDLQVSASYEADTEIVKKALIETALSNKDVLSNPAPSAVLSSFGDSNIVYILRVYCNNTDYWDLFYKLNEEVRTSFKKYGIDMSYNNLNVNINHKESKEGA